MGRKGPESDSYQVAVERSLTRRGLKRSDVPESLRGEFDDLHMPISGVSDEFSSAVARANEAGASSWHLLGMSDAELAAYDPYAPDPTIPPTEKPQE